MTDVYGVARIGSYMHENGWMKYYPENYLDMMNTKSCGEAFDRFVHMMKPAQIDSETKYELLGYADPDNTPEPVTKPLVCPYCGSSLYVTVDFNGYGGHAASMIECSNCMQGAWNADGTVM